MNSNHRLYGCTVDYITSRELRELDAVQFLRKRPLELVPQQIVAEPRFLHVYIFLSVPTALAHLH